MSSCHSRTRTWALATPGRRVGQIGQLVVVRGEQRPRSRRLVGDDELGDRPGDAHAVERRRAAADLVEDDQAPRRRGVEDAGGLAHLDHERRVAAGDVVGGADAGEDPVDHRQPRLAGRDERADLGQHREQRRLPQVGRLAAHVRAGQDDQLPRRPVQRQVVRDERLGRHPFDHRVARVDDRELAVIGHQRLGVVVQRRHFAEGGEDVEGRPAPAPTPARAAPRLQPGRAEP